MSACVCVFMYVSIHVCLWVCIFCYEYICISVNTCMWICMSKYRLGMGVCSCICVYDVCLYVYVWVCIYICSVHAHVCIYTHESTCGYLLVLCVCLYICVCISITTIKSLDNGTRDNWVQDFHHNCMSSGKFLDLFFLQFVFKLETIIIHAS